MSDQTEGTEKVQHTVRIPSPLRGRLASAVELTGASHSDIYNAGLAIVLDRLAREEPVDSWDGSVVIAPGRTAEEIERLRSILRGGQEAEEASTDA